MNVKLHFTSVIAWLFLLFFTIFTSLFYYQNKFFPFVYLALACLLMFLTFIGMKRIIQQRIIRRINIFIALLNGLLIVASLFYPDLFLELWNWLLLLTFLNFGSLTFFLIRLKKNSSSKFARIFFIGFCLLFSTEIALKSAFEAITYTCIALLALSIICWGFSFFERKAA